jgi:hypothetical protein
MLCRKSGDEFGVIDDRDSALSQLGKHGRTGFSVRLAHDERHRRFASPVAQADDLISMHDRDDRTRSADGGGAACDLQHAATPALATNERIAFELLPLPLVLGARHAHVAQEELALYQEIEQAYGQEGDGRCGSERLRSLYDFRREAPGAADGRSRAVPGVNIRRNA